MTPEQWKSKHDEMVGRHRRESSEVSKSRESVEYPATDALRPATARDVQEGAVFYYPTCDPPWWCIIDEVRYPDDDFKAFVADDGCRHGLNGAFVRKEPCP